MDEYAHQLDILLSQDNIVEASNSKEKALTDMQISSTPMESMMLTPPIKTRNFIGMANLCLVPQNL